MCIHTYVNAQPGRNDKIHVELSSFQFRGRDGPITFPDGHQPVKLKPRTKIKFFAATEQNSLPTFSLIFEAISFFRTEVQYRLILDILLHPSSLFENREGRSRNFPQRFCKPNPIIASMSVRHLSARNILSSIVVMMFSMAFSRRVATRVLVQGFSTRSSGVAARSFLATNSNLRQFSAREATQVDEDLDAALDDLLGNALKAERPVAPEITMMASKPVAPKDVETVSICGTVLVGVFCGRTLT